MAAGQNQPRVVVGIDGSESSKQALRWAQRIAAAHGASIDAIGAWVYPNTYATAAIPVDYSPEADIEKALTATVDEVFGAHRPADLRVRVLRGTPAQVLIEAAAGALMVVVGSRGLGGFMGLLLGSVSEKVAEHASCPVLVVHDGKERTS